jgi:hypothetical protein
MAAAALRGHGSGLLCRLGHLQRVWEHELRGIEKEKVKGRGLEGRTIIGTCRSYCQCVASLMVVEEREAVKGTRCASKESHYLIQLTYIW